MAAEEEPWKKDLYATKASRTSAEGGREDGTPWRRAKSKKALTPTA
jgi:hypothetical protein